jgi:hypothetical protein
LEATVSAASHLETNKAHSASAKIVVPLKLCLDHSCSLVLRDRAAFMVRGFFCALHSLHAGTMLDIADHVGKGFWLFGKDDNACGAVI